MVSWLNLVTNHWIMSKDEVNIDLNGGFFFFPPLPGFVMSRCFSNS